MQQLRCRFLNFLLVFPVFMAGCQSDRHPLESLYNPADYESGPDLLGKIQPKWHSLSPSFAAYQTTFDRDQHLFWDAGIDLNATTGLTSYIVQTPEGSPREYQINLAAGQHYSKGPYCRIKDRWDEYEGDIYLPPFTMGIIPRMFDQLMSPLKIIVFGGKKQHQKFFLTNEFKAYIIGGLIENYCPLTECLKKDQWLKRLILVGVNSEDEQFSKVKSLSELKEKVEWKYVEAFLNNAQGQRIMPKKTAPLYKVESVIGMGEAINYLKKNSLFFNGKKLKDLKVSCMKIYSEMYSHLYREEFSSNSFFHERFRNFQLKHEKKLKICSDLVFSANSFYDMKRFWFVKYLQAYTYLSDLGYRYDCNRRAWYKNPLLKTGQREVVGQGLLRFCNQEKIDQAFDLAVLKMQELKELGKPYYYLVSYDRGSYGTHAKIDSWVYHDGSGLDCQERARYNKDIKILPQKMRWRSNFKQMKKDVIIK